VAGFYTSTKNYLAYDLRTHIASDDEVKMMPDDWELQLEGVKNKLLQEKPQYPGDAIFLINLFHATLNIAFHWMVSQKKSFSVVYDPRQPKEDRFVLRQTAEWIEKYASAFDLRGFYRGVSSSASSNQSAGLMLADLILRDVRFFFSDYPELLTDNTGKKLILPVHQEHEPIVTMMQGTPLKWGHRIPMSPSLKKCLRASSRNSVLPIYAENLADMKLSCYGAFGEGRVINFRQHCFEDMVD